MKLLARKGVWYVRWQDASGRDHKKSLRTRDYTEAKRMALRMELGLLEDTPLIGEESTVNSLVEWFLKRPHNLRPRSRTRQEQALRRVVKGLGKFSVNDPGFRGKVKLYQASRVKDGAAASTVNQEVGALKQVLNEAIDCFEGLVNPLVGLKRVRGRSQVKRGLTTGEVRNVLAVLRTPDEWLRFGLFVFTGMRRGEAIHLQWSSVDLDRGVIFVEPHDGWQPKNGEARAVPICRELKRILQDAPKRSLYVLTTRDGQPFHADNGNPLLRWFKKLYKRAGIKDWKSLGVHTTRHTYCSRLAQMNVRSELRAAIVGHRTLAMQNVYTHTEEQDALDAGRKVNYA